MKISILPGNKINPHQKKDIDDFVRAHPLGTIHQLIDWGLFQTKSAERERFWVIKIEDARPPHKILASALILRQNLPLNKCWLYCPRGPLVDYSNPKITAALFAKITELANGQNAVFFRFDPAIVAENNHKSVPGHTSAPMPGFTSAPSPIDSPAFIPAPAIRPAHAHYQPESTLIIDLSPEPNLILAQMKPKGRYNIKVAQKHGVTFKVAPTSKVFYDLLTQTTARDNFSGHSLKYYQEMLAVLGHQQAKLYLAEYTPPPVEATAAHHQSATTPPAPVVQSPQVLAAAIVTYFNDTATYYFGASSNQYRNVMAPYLLHWQIMMDAKAAGYKFYDMFGISPEQPNLLVPSPKQQPRTPAPARRHSYLIPASLYPSAPRSHPWATVTDFKLKFGGTRVNYIPAQEIIYKPGWFKVILISKFLRACLKSPFRLIRFSKKKI